MGKTFIFHPQKVKKLAAKHLPVYFETPCMSIFQYWYGCSMLNLIIIISIKLCTSIGIGIPCYPGNIQHNQFSLDAIDVISITSKVLQYVVDGVICPKSEEKHWLVNLKN